MEGPRKTPAAKGRSKDKGRNDDRKVTTASETIRIAKRKLAGETAATAPGPRRSRQRDEFPHDALASAGGPAAAADVVAVAGAAPDLGDQRSRTMISPEERHRMIAELAYFRAERRGFHGGAEIEDWLAAEAEVDTKLLSGS